jgi:hypothetical protein
MDSLFPSAKHERFLDSNNRRSASDQQKALSTEARISHARRCIPIESQKPWTALGMRVNSEYHWS